MLIYISSYPRSGNSLMQNLIGNFFERPMTAIEENGKIIFTKSTKNWRHNNGLPLAKNQQDLQSLAAGIRRNIFQNTELDQWLVWYDLNVPPYTKDRVSLLPGCYKALTLKNRQKLASNDSYIFVKTHGFPCELLRGQAHAASYPADRLVVDFLRPPLLGLTSGR